MSRGIVVDLNARSVGATYCIHVSRTCYIQMLYCCIQLSRTCIIQVSYYVRAYLYVKTSGFHVRCSTVIL